ncbi:MAG: hypothetical protein ACR2OZ_06925 [Verrucomicrobiales bacterium]
MRDSTFRFAVVGLLASICVVLVLILQAVTRHPTAGEIFAATTPEAKKALMLRRLSVYVTGHVDATGSEVQISR